MPLIIYFYLMLCQNLINTCNSCFKFSNDHLKLKSTRLNINSSCVRICLLNISNWSVVPPAIHTTLWISKHITLLILYQFNSTLVNAKFIYSFLQVSNILLIVCFRLFNVISLQLVEPLTPVGVEGILISPFIYSWGMWWRSWLRHCTTSQKVTVSIPDGVICPGVDSAFNTNEF